MRAKYVLSRYDSVSEAAEAVAAPWFCGDKNLAGVKGALAPHLRNLFMVLNNDLVMLAVRPVQN